MEIRRLMPSDSRAELSRIYEESWKYAYRGIIPQFYLDSIPSGRWADSVDGEGRYSLILLDRGRMIGTSSFSQSRFAEMPDWGEIISIYLLPEYMGKGIGGSILNAALFELGQMGFSRCFLWVLEENARARHFYEREGFSESGRTIDDEIGGKALREVQYIKIGLF